MKLQTGEFYLNADGQIINITNFNKKGFYEDGYKTLYLANGKEANGYEINSNKDLIAHIPKALHYNIIKTIKAYHTDDITKHYIDNAYNNKENK